MDENLRSGLGDKEVASHSSEDVVHFVDGENVDEGIRKVKEDENNAVEETIDVQQPCGEEVMLDEVLMLGQECLDCTVEGSSEKLEEAKPLLVNCMSLVCEHRNQLDSRSDLQAKIGDFASRFLYVLFRLEAYEECILWFDMGIRTNDALKRALEASGSVQYNVAISFLKTAGVRTDRQRLQHLIGRGSRHLERSCMFQVDNFDTLKLKMLNTMSFDVATGIITVSLGHLSLVPGEMFEKLLGTPHSHFTNQQVIHLLDEVLASAIDMKDKGWLVEAETVLNMGLTFASKIEDQEIKDRFVESIQTELPKSYESTHRNQKVPMIDETELRKALESTFVETANKNFESAEAGIQVASTSSSAEMQPCGEEVQLDEVLTLGQECLQDFTVEGSSEKLEEAKPFLVNCMSLVCEHRNQLDSRSDLQAKIGDFASRFLYVLFRLEDYEECIRWFGMGIRTNDALKRALEASGSVQYNVAISLLKTADVGTDRQTLQYLIGRGSHHLERSCMFQVDNFDNLKLKMHNTVNFDGVTGIITVSLGHLSLVPGEMFEKLLGTPHSHFTNQQVIHLLDEVLASAIDMKDKGWLVEGEAVLNMGLTFASKIEDQEIKDRFVESIQKELPKSYESTHRNQKAQMIDEMTVCEIPSIRALHRCFQNQAGFEKGWKDSEHPFVAGNPIPMGAGLKDLPFAALEAEKVAKILDGAQLFSGEKMTKAAAFRGLSRSQVVSLSTHGILNSYHPRGALVLRKSDSSPSSSSEAPLSPAQIVANESNRRLEERHLVQLRLLRTNPTGDWRRDT